MSGFAVCVLVEWFLAVRSSWCSRDLPVLLLGPDRWQTQGLGMQLRAGSCSCPALSPKAFWV